MGKITINSSTADCMHVIQTYGEMEAWFHSFFSSALDGGKWPVT